MPSSALRIAIRHFTTQWFLIPQGTGILSVILHQLDFQFNGLQAISVIYWFITFITLFLFLLIYITRILLYPKEVFNGIIHNNTEAACLSSISITFTSVIQMLSLVVVPSWGGHDWTIVVYVLWWINTGMALAACFCIPVVFIRFTTLHGRLQQAYTPATQLPIIATLTSAAGAGTICSSALLGSRQQVPMIIIGYMELSVGIPLALALDTLFWARHFLPWQNPDLNLSRRLIFTEMILCGPWGQGSFALQSLGKAMLQGAFANYGHSKGALWTNSAATTIGYGSIFFGLLSWSTSAFWWLFASVGIIHAGLGRTDRPGLSFSLSTWAIVFPWGVYTNAAVELGKVLDSPVFRVWSTTLAVALVIIWLILMILTAKGIITGHLLGLEHGWKMHHQR